MKSSYILKKVNETKETSLPKGVETSIPQADSIFYSIWYPIHTMTDMIHYQSDLEQASLANMI